MDKASEYKLTVPKTARYYVLDPPEGTPVRLILYAIHGYRQLGKYFIRHFAGLQDLGVKVVVPEGLHRFYIEGYSGKVGASWMTKEAREDDIKDQINYLNALKQLTWKPNVAAAVLGFSQGGPTACRWLADNAEGINGLILHSTVFPNDFDFEASQHWLTTLQTTSIFGDQDEFADEATIAKKMDWIRSKGVETDLLRFEGGHKIHLNSLRKVLEQFLG
jgi:predicted esterase